MKIVAISDVHERWQKLQIPECDLLISAGDYSFRGEERKVREFHEWLHRQPAKHVISNQGNHELWVEKNFQQAKDIALKACPRVHFVDHNLIEIEGLKIFSSAWTPWFHDWAWNAQRGEEIRKLWDQIPEDIDILITHGPPYKILDEVNQRMRPDYDFRKDRNSGTNVGCEDLFQKILKCKSLKHHFFGHIHEAYGHKEFMGKHFWNVSICDSAYSPVNPVVVVDL